VSARYAFIAAEKAIALMALVATIASATPTKAGHGAWADAFADGNRIRRLAPNGRITSVATFS
jgi:hypothetical protein